VLHFHSVVDEEDEREWHHSISIQWSTCMSRTCTYTHMRSTFSCWTQKLQLFKVPTKRGPPNTLSRPTCCQWNQQLNAPCSTGRNGTCCRRKTKEQLLWYVPTHIKHKFLLRKISPWGNHYDLCPGLKTLTGWDLHGFFSFCSIAFLCNEHDTKRSNRQHSWSKWTIKPNIPHLFILQYYENKIEYQENNNKQ